jgi:bacterial/archaeal transporter family-2 protein
MKMVLIHMLLAFLGGTFLALQAGLNTQLRILTGHPISAMFISVLVSLLTAVLIVLLYSLTGHLPLPSLEKLAQAPGWIWTGGVLGGFYVWFIIILASKLGATVLFGLVVAGQVMASLVIDHHGLFGLPHHPVNLLRAFGVVLLILGVILVRRF